MPRKGVCNSDASVRQRIPLFLVILAASAVPLFARDPRTATAMLIGTGIVVGIIALVIIRFRRYLDNVIPLGWIGHRSRTVRAMTRVARAYGLYLVGFCTFIALLLLFQALDHLV